MAIEQLCLQCGKPHKVRRMTKVYCSTLCRVNAANAKKRQLLMLPDQQPETAILSNTEKQK